MQKIFVMIFITTSMIAAHLCAVNDSPAVVKAPNKEAPPVKKVDAKAAPVKAAPASAKNVVEKKPEHKGASVDAKLEKELDLRARLIQKNYDTTNSAKFRFEQIYVHPFLSGPESKTSSKGDVSYDKKSGSMMWNYVEPKERQKKFFINRNRFTFYSVSDKIAYTHNCYDKDTLSASIAFLLGTGSLKTSFTIVAFDGEPANKNLLWLSLIPKEANAPVKRISLGATKEGRVVESIVEDPSGGKNHFKFIDFKANPKIDESVFIFKAPAGVSVQPMPNIECKEKNVAEVKPAAPTPPQKPAPKKK